MKLKAPASALEKIQVLYQDDRDDRHPDRWKVYRYRVEGERFELMINGEWCPLPSHRLRDSALKNFQAYGYTHSIYGFLSAEPAEPPRGFTTHPRLLSRFNFLSKNLYGSACAMLGLKWPVTKEGVKQAYRNRSKTAHPDTGGSHEEFQAVKEAYELLMNYCNQEKAA